MKRSPVPSFQRALLALFATTIAWSAHAQTSDPVVQRIQKSGVLRIAFNPANKPFSFPGPDGQPTGYAIDLCNIVAQRLGPALGLPGPVKVEYRRIKSSERIPLLTEGAIDMECSTSTNTLERQKSVGFSLTYFTAAGRMLIDKRKGIKDYQDLKKDTRILVVKGTTGQATFAARLHTLGISANIVEADSQTDVEQMLKEGKADGYVTDDVLLYALRGKLPDPEQWDVVGKNLSVEPYGVMLSKDAKQFEAMVDSALRETYASGAVLDIYNRWFQTKDFQMPMNLMTREAFKWPNKIGVGKSF